MENATTAGSSQSNVSRLYIWKDKFESRILSKIKNAINYFYQSKVKFKNNLHNKTDTTRKRQNAIILIQIQIKKFHHDVDSQSNVM